jgi:hypothetical protein
MMFAVVTHLVEGQKSSAIIDDDDDDDDDKLSLLSFDSATSIFQYPTKRYK